MKRYFYKLFLITIERWTFNAFVTNSFIFCTKQREENRFVKLEKGFFLKRRSIKVTNIIIERNELNERGWGNFIFKIQLNFVMKSVLVAWNM